MRWALSIEYDGSAYHGWQNQAHSTAATVQNAVERALSLVADHPVTVTCAGRTDRGVHALAQVVHFDTTAIRQPHAWLMGCNHFLPADIRVLWAQSVPAEFHARYSATARRYCYLIYNHPIRPALTRQHVTWFSTPLDAEKMAQASQYLLGEHDFSAFRSADCQSRTPQRCIDTLRVYRNNTLIHIEIQANAFLHHMVRNIVGVLKEIGQGKRPPQWAQQVLLGRARSGAGVTAPPNGLYLTHVHYPDHWQLPSTNENISPLPLAGEGLG